MLRLDENFEQRLEFVRYWAKYVKKTDPKIWSKQQKELIDSVLSTANQEKDLYLKIKKIVKNIRQADNE